jgi:hypothetical protein
MAKGQDRIPKAAGMFQPYLERAVSFLDVLSQPAGIEGEVILPETAARLRSNHAVRAVFLFRRAVMPADIGDSRRPNPWLRDAPAELVAAITTEVVSWSGRVEEACKRLRIPCFDVAGNFDHALEEAADALRLADDQTSASEGASG